MTKLQGNIRTSVLFVCMGNICRSPTAEAVFRHQVKAAGFEKAIYIDSAGTHDFHTVSRRMKGLREQRCDVAMNKSITCPADT